MKILVVDDEPQIRKLLHTGLAGFGHEVETAVNGQTTITSVLSFNPDLVILDINLGVAPDGIEVCRQLRDWSHVPIIMLSVRGEERTKVDALNAGADDYLTKPFGMEELQARIQAIIRRTAKDNGPSDVHEMRVGDLVINFANRLVLVEGQQVHLTPKEYELLTILALHPGKVITHHTLLQKIWDIDDRSMDHYVRVFVNQLRKKLHENPARNLRYIINEPGVGYRFVDPSTLPST